MIILEYLWVLLLFPLPWIMRALLPRTSASTQARLRVPFFKNIETLTGKQAKQQDKRSLNQRLVLLAIWASLVFAAAGPQRIGDPVMIHSKARDLMLLVDLSGSMRAMDMRVKGEQVDRLVAVKHAMDEFIDKRQGDRMGLIVYGDNAYVLTPLTFDHKTLRHQLDETFIGMAGPRTAMGDAMGLGIKRLMDQPSESRVMILLTDGHYNIGELNPLTAARIAAEYGLKIYTIGFEPDEVMVRGPFGQRMMARSDLHEPELIKIAEITGGEYYRATNTDSLRRIYDVLDKLEPIETDPEVYRPKKSLFYVPLAFGLGLSVLFALHALLQGWWQSRSESKPSAPVPGTATDA